ncbi:MAG: glycosyltransferase [Ruminococcus sp.]|nr:glycosyltransferase [Ruminococcus sp.]
MKITYISDYLTIHLRAFAEDMYRILGSDFCFVETISTKSVSKENSYRMGYAYYQASNIAYEAIPWRLQAFNSDKERKQCVDLINSSDVVIIGNAKDIWIKNRLERGLVTFRAHERWYKKKLPFYLLPKAIIGAWIHHGRYKNLYMLCASAYTASDTHKVCCFKNKVYKWGYFPKTKVYNIEKLFSDKDPSLILWTGRAVDWKHPEYCLEVADKLKNDGYKFHIKIIGIENKDSNISNIIKEKELDDFVSLHGFMSPDDVRKNMEKSGIYIFTSDRNEGWGVVLNESMNSGCAVVASNEIGSVPYLLRNNENGLIYKSNRIDMLYDRVKYLLDNPDQQRKLGTEAYYTILNMWNSKTAAERLVKLCHEICSKNYSNLYEDGPCSVSPIIKEKCNNL